MLHVRVGEAGAPRRASLRQVAAVIADGGLIAYPTESYYALGADALRARAVARVHAVKRRDPSDPLLLLLDDDRRAHRYMSREPSRFDAARRLLWPGPVTLIVPASPDLPAGVTGGGDTVGLRVVDQPSARALVRVCDAALTGTSANRSGEPPLSSPERVAAELGDELDALVDAGDTPGGPPSTLLDLSREPPRVLREGAVSRDRIAELLGTRLL